MPFDRKLYCHYLKKETFLNSTDRITEQFQPNDEFELYGKND